jgi:predicted nucleotide-binding protein
MATRTKKAEQPGPPQLPPEQSLVLLRKQIVSGKELFGQPPIEKGIYGQWQLVTKNVLEKAFGTNSPNVTNFEGVGRVFLYTNAMDEAWWARHRRETLETQLPRLEGLAELIETEMQLRAGAIADLPSVEPVAPSHRIFLVHGHNEAALNEVARFLERLRQDVVVLRELPNQGRTIIEKFEEHANVGFAVVLLTGDDHGATSSSNELQLRARQNVIFELGYFIARLGRARVCALYQSGVEWPSDYSGVLYHELDSRGSWRLELARELKAAGLPVDMNLAL